jgi:hypothetical protein
MSEREASITAAIEAYRAIGLVLARLSGALDRSAESARELAEVLRNSAQTPHLENTERREPAILFRHLRGKAK